MLPPLQLLGAGSSSVALGLLACGLVSVSAYAVLGTGSAHKTDDGHTPVPYLASSIPLIGNMLQLAGNLHRYHDWVTEQVLLRGGKPFVLRLLGKSDLLFTASPEHFQEVQKTQSSNFNKSDTVREVFDDFLGEDIVLLNGKRWQFHRKILASLITTKALREYMAPIVQEHVRQVQEVLQKASDTNEPFDVSKLMRQFTLDTFAEIGFGYKLGVLVSGKEHPFEVAFDDANRISSERLAVPEWIWKLKRWLNVGSERRLREATGEMNELMLQLINNAVARTKESGAAKNDILSIIVHKMKTSEQELTSSVVRDISLAGLEAGRNTTADALSWLLHSVSAHPDVEQKLRDEVAAKIPKIGASASYVPSYEDVQELPYLEATIREALRLYPAVPTIPYHCACDTVFADGTFIPAGTDVFLALYAAGRLTSVWGEDATKFSPERFVDAGTGELLKEPPSRYTAFSDGRRVCVGQNLAMLELKVAAATVLSRFRFIEEPAQDVRPIFELTLRMKNPLMMRVMPVGQQAGAASS
jgi:cytochrome P450